MGQAINCWRVSFADGASRLIRAWSYEFCTDTRVHCFYDWGEISLADGVGRGRRLESFSATEVVEVRAVRLPEREGSAVSPEGFPLPDINY